MPPKKRTTTRTRSGFPCPDCDFVAKHAMGLGRHRSTRHGVVSQRAARRGAQGGWLTREQAAAYAGVHYNTIRHWERSGAVRAQRRPGVRGTLIDTADLNRVLADRSGSGAGGADAASLRALEQRFRDLIDGLERLVASVKLPAAPAPKRGRPPASRAKKKPAAAGARKPVARRQRKQTVARRPARKKSPARGRRR